MLSRAHFAAIHRALAAAGIVEPVRPEDGALFVDCDLCSFAEGRLGERVDPRTLDAATRSRFIERATRGELPPPEERDGEACFWLLEDGRRIGTVSLGTEPAGRHDMYLGSYLVFPEVRGTGAAARAYDRIRRGVFNCDLGLRLNTKYTWPYATRFWLGRGLWVYGWRPDLRLIAHRWMGRPSLEFDSTRAAFFVEQDRRRVELFRAWQRAGRLVLRRTGIDAVDPEGALGHLHLTAASTFAVELSLRGFPLLRSQAAWAGFSEADGGAPEGLAARLAAWAAECDAEGWCAAPASGSAQPRPST